MLFLALLPACSPPGDVKLDDSGGDTTDTDTDTTDTDTTGGGDDTGYDTVPGESPSVVSVTASCNTDPDDYDRWNISASGSDPQGAGDIATMGSTVTVLDADGATLGSYPLACSSGVCVGSWSENDDGIDCDVGGASTFRVVLVDGDGNHSAPYDYQPG